MSTDKHISIIVDPLDVDTRQARLLDSLCYILVMLGIIGNVFGLLTFSLSRRTWRISTVYVYLATSSSIANLLCVARYASVLHSKSRHILHNLVGQTWWACKMFEFSSSFRVISSWITLFWMFERVICVSNRLRLFFARCVLFQLHWLIPLIMLFSILACVTGPPIYMFESRIIQVLTSSNSTIHVMTCDINSNASIQWQNYFHEVHFGMNHFTIRCLFSELLPAGAIILFDSYIVYRLIETHHHLHRTRLHSSRKEQEHFQVTSWMNVVLILHSLLFLFSLFAHITGHFLLVEAHETWWILLAVLMNCSLNFYIYCLSGRAFRNEIRRFIQLFKSRICHRQEHFCNSQTAHEERPGLRDIVQL